MNCQILWSVPLYDCGTVSCWCKSWADNMYSMQPVAMDTVASVEHEGAGRFHTQHCPCRVTLLNGAEAGYEWVGGCLHACTGVMVHTREGMCSVFVCTITCRDWDCTGRDWGGSNNLEVAWGSSLLWPTPVEDLLQRMALLELTRKFRERRKWGHKENLQQCFSNCVRPLPPWPHKLTPSVPYPTL